MVCFLINRVFFLVLRPCNAQIAVATVLYHFLHYQNFSIRFSVKPLLDGHFTLHHLFFLLDDFARFAVHYALHKIPLLWEFHKITKRRNTHPTYSDKSSPRSSLHSTECVSSGCNNCYIFVFVRSTQFADNSGCKCICNTFSWARLKPAPFIFLFNILEQLSVSLCPLRSITCISKRHSAL